MRQMKDSGVEWIGEIPIGWQVSRIKELFAEVNERCINGADYNLLSVSEYYGVAPKAEKISEEDMLTHAETLDGYKLCQPNDIVMNIMLAWKRALGASKYEGIISPAYCVYRPREGVCSRYFHYLYRTDVYANLFKQYSTGIIDSRLRLYPDKFLALKCQVPPMDVQQRIIEFLDIRCAKIDSVIARQQEAIEKLKTYKLSVIIEAVTKGLNPDVPMKDSGNEWIGRMPQHWTVVKLGTIFDFLGGYAFNSDDYSDESENQIIRIGNVKNDKLILDANPVFVNNSVAEIAEKFRIKEGTILFTMTGTKGKRDYFFTHLVRKQDIKTRRLYLNQRVGCLIPTEMIYAGYYNYLLKDKRILDSIFIYETGTANQGNLGIESIRRTKLHFPPVEEQKAISNYLDKKCCGIDRLIERKMMTIEKLLEYKKALIYEVVTGKREV